MSDSIQIPRAARFDATIADLPGSKSLTNRALLLAALAEGPSELSNVLIADDSRVMIESLARLGFELAIDEPGRRAVIHGEGGAIPAMEAELFLGNAGTAMRFLAAAVCLGRGVYELDGVSRMRQRPIAQLVDPLRELGARIEFAGDEGFPPLRVFAQGLEGGVLTLQPTLSSQYISALLMVAPCMRRGLTIAFQGALTSEPYVRMTLQVMRVFGLERCEWNERERYIEIDGGQGYRGTVYRIEPDASNASYFLAAAAVVPGSRCVIRGLGSDSCQGDAGFIRVLEAMGCVVKVATDSMELVGPGKLRGVEVNLNAMPDMAQTLAVVALFAQGPTTIRDVGNLRVKETDRMEALRAELVKLGAVVEVRGDDLMIVPPPDNRIQNAAIDTYDDHRMAMSFAVAALGSGAVTINDPSCVNKTFPDFWQYWKRLTAPS
jgi:3-phosphoshikimate 1-carboxyvinyltransferase